MSIDQILIVILWTTLLSTNTSDVITDSNDITEIGGICLLWFSALQRPEVLHLAVAGQA